MTIDIGLIRYSWSLVEPVAGKLAMHFYGRLFANYPHIREMFPPAMDMQRDRLLQALTQVVLNLEDGEGLSDYLGTLARDHRKYGVRPEHYPAVGSCLVAAMRYHAQGAWLPAYDDAWMTAYNFIAEVMIQAAEQDAAQTPPTWVGTVVSHEVRTPEVAVITVAPDQPYPFRAGQYATLQSAHWPRVWRSYSIANAPREDNLLSFHVRMVSGGWVSTALMHHTRPGDSLLLGPPRGSLVLDRASSSHLVFIAGGTGLAPSRRSSRSRCGCPTAPPSTSSTASGAAPTPTTTGTCSACGHSTGACGSSRRCPTSRSNGPGTTPWTRWTITGSSRAETSSSAAPPRWCG